MKLQIIVGSTRPDRVSDKLAVWVANEAKRLTNTEVEVVDLLNYELPFLDEAISPQYNPNRSPNVEAQRWLTRLDGADAYVLVTPEYNRSTSGVLKNALDYIDFQFTKKPIALVGHGSSGGAQAVAHLRGIISGLQAISIPSAVYFVGRVGEMIDSEGNLVDQAIAANPYGPQGALKQSLAQLQWYSDALKRAREVEVAN
jgi:NAD(P)H-dependent FMN reductase